MGDWGLQLEEGAAAEMGTLCSLARGVTWSLGGPGGSASLRSLGNLHKIPK